MKVHLKGEAVRSKALACELPHKLGLPLSRLSIEEIRHHVISQGLVAEISGATLWRWLSSDALRPWQHRSWIFPRHPNFADKAGPILDLYERTWEGAPLGADDYVISADEKTSIQARRRKQPTLPPAPNCPMRVEHEYFRQGAWTYLAAWDVHQAKVFGRCEVKSGIAPVDRLVSDVMGQEPNLNDEAWGKSGPYARLGVEPQGQAVEPGRNACATCLRSSEVYRVWPR